MKSLLIRNLEDATMEGLKIRARKHHRSLQKEVEALLRDAAEMVAPDQGVNDSVLSGLRVVATGRRHATFSRDSTYGDDGR